MNPIRAVPMTDTGKAYATLAELEALQRTVEDATGFDCEYVKGLRVSAWLALIATAKAGLMDRARLDWLEKHHYRTVSLAVGKAWPNQPLRDAIDAATPSAEPTP
jgi:hypothetical protein